MKNFTKKSILQKTIIAILVALLLSNFIVPTYSHAVTASEAGGVLLSPIVDLICSLGDAVINLLQWCMTGDFGSSGSTMNWSLSAFLAESSAYYSDHDTPSGNATVKVNPDNDFDKGWFGKKDEYYVPVATYSPEQIFAGNVPGLDINFIDPNEYKDKDGNSVESSAAILQPTIATWYVALRNLTVVGLLSILVYVGIRIIISSTASDKAKYKQMLMDWLIALCLVFFLHYIMSFTLTLTQSICEAIVGDGESTVIVEDLSAKDKFSTNLLGLARFQTQYKEFGPKMAYLIMYIALIWNTLRFTWFYLNRLLMMAFLTLIAPVVALTYPIDKMNDGKAQAFDAWLKEYIFNALIQPFHLIIYTVFVGSAMDLATTNIIYMIAALWFIGKAEEILRKFFGFEKARSGTLGALAGGAAFGSIAKKLIGGSGKSGKGSGGKAAPEGDKPPNFQRNNSNINDLDAPNNENEDSKNINFNDNQETEAQESNIHDRAAQMLSEEEKNMSVQDYKESGMKPQEWRENRQKELEEQLKQQQQQQSQEQNKKTSLKDRTIGLAKHTGRGALNLARHHGNQIKRGTIKGVKNLGKFGLKTAFRAATGTLPAAIALASGGGLGAAAAAYMAAAPLADRASSAVLRTPQALRREIDIFNGNTNMQDKAEVKDWYKDENNYNYFRDKLISENGGKIPSDRKVKEEMQKYDPYLQRDIKDIKDMVKAQKLAETYKLDPKDVALITAIEKKDGVTKEMLSDKNKASAYQENLMHQLSKQKSPEDARRTAEFAVNVMKERNGVANNLQKIDKSQQPKTTKK